MSTKAILVERKGFRGNWALFAAQVQSMGTRGHKGKHSAESESRSKKEVFVVISAGTKSLGINIETPIVEENQEATIILVDHFNEEGSPIT
jgi:hypothetical protein